MKAKEAVSAVRHRLSSIGAEHEAREITAFALGCKKESLITDGDRELGFVERLLIDAAVDERLAGRPLQYILGGWDFCGLPFAVREGVLIPRDETELLFLRAKRAVEERGFKSALDMCTGSGCIAVALFSLCGIRVCAADVSDVALETARENCVRNKAEVELIKSDLFSCIPGRFDMIVSNPPYIRTGDIDTLMTEVREYEPLIALDGGEDGLDFYRRITKSAPNYLNAEGMLLFEAGEGQSNDIIAIMEDNGFEVTAVTKDLAGIDRVVEGVLRQPNTNPQQTEETYPHV